MSDRSFIRRLGAADFNLEQFRSELADEAQLVQALPAEVRVQRLRNAQQREQGQVNGGPSPERDGH